MALLEHKFIEAYKKLLLQQVSSGDSENFNLIEYRSPQEEMVAITCKISLLIESGIDPEKTAVVCPQNNFSMEMAQYLQLKEIPFYQRQSINVLEHPFAKKIIKILQYIDKVFIFPQEGDNELFEILHFDLFNNDSEEIIELCMEANNKKSNPNRISMKELLFKKCHTPPKDLFDKGCSQQLKNCCTLLENLLMGFDKYDLLGLLNILFNDTVIQDYITKNTENLLLQKLLSNLNNLAKITQDDFPLINAENNHSIIDKFLKIASTVTIQSIVGNNHGVHLNTTHTPELENFTHIYFVGITHYFQLNKSSPLFKYSTLKELLAVKNKQAEALQLLENVLNCAALGVQISFAKNNKKGEERAAAIAIVATINQHQLPLQKVTISEQQLTEFYPLIFSANQPQIAAASESIIAPLLNKFVLSATALNNFLRCPLHFYYQHIIKAPSTKNEYFEFGSAIHHALENLFKKMQDDQQNIFPSTQQLVDDFTFYMHKSKIHFTSEAFENRLKYGTSVLTNYYNHNIKEWNKIVAVERNIQSVIINGVPIKGKIDKLEFNGKEINVIDYKSGNIEKALEQLKPPHNENPQGGNYWRQAVFYKILVDNYQQKNWTVVSTEFDFIEPDKNGNYRKEKVNIQTQDVETVKQQIISVWSKIQSRSFYIGCGKQNCYWCNFVKNNNLVVAMH